MTELNDVELPKLSKADLKRLRESECYKFNNISDFKSIRRCFVVAKELVECLRYFDSRATRFQVVTQNQQFYNLSRARHYPDEYLNFSYHDVKISLYKRKTDYFVGVQGHWIPKTLGQQFDQYMKPMNMAEVTIHRYLFTDNFSEAKDNFLKAVSEFIADYFDSVLVKKENFDGLLISPISL